MKSGNLDIRIFISKYSWPNISFLKFILRKLSEWKHYMLKDISLYFYLSQVNTDENQKQNNTDICSGVKWIKVQQP